MSNCFQMKERFGSFLSDGEVANAFRFTEVEPLIARGEHVVFEMAGVTNMTDSFGNALFGTLFKNHPELLRGGMEFRNCSPLMRALITAAIQFAKMAGRRQQTA
jgi:STAS-like domain of unknown function (DUF4325)